MDVNKERVKHWHLTLSLSNFHNVKHTGIVRYKPVDPVSKFLLEVRIYNIRMSDAVLYANAIHRFAHRCAQGSVGCVLCGRPEH